MEELRADITRVIAMMTVMQTELKETKDKNTELESRLTDNYKDSIQAENRIGS